MISARLNRKTPIDLSMADDGSRLNSNLEKCSTYRQKNREPSTDFCCCPINF